MKANNPAKVPSIPMVIESIVPCCTCPPRSFRKSQAEALSAIRTMTVYMPAQNANINFCFRVNSHVFWKVQHARAKFF